MAEGVWRESRVGCCSQEAEAPILLFFLPGTRSRNSKLELCPAIGVKGVSNKASIRAIGRGGPERRHEPNGVALGIDSSKRNIDTTYSSSRDRATPAQHKGPRDSVLAHDSIDAQRLRYWNLQHSHMRKRAFSLFLPVVDLARFGSKLAMPRFRWTRVSRLNKRFS